MSGNPSFPPFFFFCFQLKCDSIYQMTCELNGFQWSLKKTKQTSLWLLNGTQCYLKRKQPCQHLLFDRFKMGVWCLFAHHWTISPLQTTNYGWILRITSVGDLFPVVLGPLLCVPGNCRHTHSPLYIHNKPVKRKATFIRLQQDPLLLFDSLVRLF